MARGPPSSLESFSVMSDAPEIRGRVVVAMVARAPSVPGKLRLAAGLTPGQHLALREALFDDGVDCLCGAGQAAHAVVFEPAEARDEVRQRVPHGVALVPQTDGDLGARMMAACEHLLAAGASGVVLIGSDLPDLPASRIERAVGAILEAPGQVVIGPATDGGYYLIGLTACHRPLFTGIEWGTPAVLAQTCQRAAEAGLSVVTLEPWDDVDTPGDLERLAARATGGARHTRAWIRAHRAHA